MCELELLTSNLCSPSVLQISAGLHLLLGHSQQHGCNLWACRHPHIAARVGADLLWLEGRTNGETPTPQILPIRQIGLDSKH